MIDLNLDDTHKHVLELTLEQAKHIDDPPKFDIWNWLKNYLILLRYTK